MICIWKQCDDNELFNIGEIYFNKYFIMRFYVWGEGREQDQLVYIGEIQLQKNNEFSESTIFSNVLGKIGLFQNQLESDDVSASVIKNAHVRSDERSASNWNKKTSCFYIQNNEDIAVQANFFFQNLNFCAVLSDMKAECSARRAFSYTMFANWTHAERCGVSFFTET